MCPKPSVLVGINAAATGSIRRVSPVCATLHVPGSFSLATDFARTTMPLGAVEGGTTSVCATPLIGFAGRARSPGVGRIDRFIGRCASVTLASASPSELKLSVAASTDRFTVGPDGADAFPATDCAAGSVAIGLRLGKSDADGVVAIGLVCGEPWLWDE